MGTLVLVACATAVGDIDFAEDKQTSDREARLGKGLALSPSVPRRCIPFAPRDIRSHPAQTAIVNLGGSCVVRGYGDGSFRPDREVTRAEFAAMLGTLMVQAETSNVPSFRDVPAWALPHVARAYSAGFVKGFSDTEYRPNAPVTREQAISAIVEGLGMLDGGVASRHRELAQAFDDANTLSVWARENVRRGYRHGLLDEDLLMYGGHVRRLRPREPATRAEIASFIDRAFGVAFTSGPVGDFPAQATFPSPNSPAGPGTARVADLLSCAGSCPSGTWCQLCRGGPACVRACE